MPVLRVVPLDKIWRHEEVDPFRVARLQRRIDEEGTQVNPMICAEAPGGDLVVLDGATRTEALKGLGLQHAVIQLVDPEEVVLETWHHVVRQASPSEVISQIETREELVLADGDQGTPRVHIAGDGIRSVLGKGSSVNSTLSSLVESYVGRWTVSRVTDPSYDEVAWRFPDWAVMVEFPILHTEDVMKAAIGDDHLPAGVTRFVVPERALRLNVDLSLLRSDASQGEKQEALDAMLATRARAGRIRRYEETIIILDD
jgi:hypothetical protein